MGSEELSQVRVSDMEDIMVRDHRTTGHRLFDRHAPRDGATIYAIAANRPACQKFRTKRAALSTVANFDADRTTCQVSVYAAGRVIRSNHLHVRFTRSNFTSAFNTWLRIGTLLIAWCVVVRGAPARTHKDALFHTPMKWVNPCGVPFDDFPSIVDVVQLPDDQLINQILLQAKTALAHAKLFENVYIRKTFNTDFADMNSMWRNNHYEWLPTILNVPKQLGEKLDDRYLKKLEVHMLDEILLNTYQNLQKFAVAIEQVVYDQQALGLEFKNHFKETESHLRTVLCEVQVALVERGVPMRPDVKRETMPDEYRFLMKSNTFRNLRDWFIYRDYMNGLEGVIDVFTHLLNKLKV